MTFYIFMTSTNITYILLVWLLAVTDVDTKDSVSFEYSIDWRGYE